jgi:hypothetical protein
MSLTSALVGGECSAWHPSRFTRDTRWIEGRAASRTNLVVVVKRKNLSILNAVTRCGWWKGMWKDSHWIWMVSCLGSILRESSSFPCIFFIFCTAKYNAMPCSDFHPSFLESARVSLYSSMITIHMYILKSYPFYISIPFLFLLLIQFRLRPVPIL